YVGSEMERTLGTWRYLWVYLISGIVGSLVSVAFQPWNVSVGASGAIFGIFGAAFSNVGGVPFDEVLGSMKRRLMVLAIMLVVVILPGYFIPGIDNSAHFGGLFAGLILGFAFIANQRKDFRPAVIGGIAAVTLGPLLAFFLIFNQYRDDPRLKSQPLYVHGEAALADKKYDVALQDFETAITALGDDEKYKKEKSAALKGKTGALIQLKRYDEALATISVNETLAEKKTPLLATKALIMQRLGKYPEAIALYKEAAEQEPDNGGISNDMAWAQAAMGDLDEALINVNKALAKNDKQTSALDTRGTVYLLQKNYDAAIKDFDRALSLNPKEGAAYFHRAGANLQKGEDEECDNDLKAAKELKYEPDPWEPKSFPDLVARLNKI
nr:rhomboid family intramembrane serine protease [Candidatus Melainabacteria bacterium]